MLQPGCCARGQWDGSKRTRRLGGATPAVAQRALCAARGLAMQDGSPRSDLSCSHLPHQGSFHKGSTAEEA